MMISQSGTLYKIIVTSCMLLGVNHLSLSTGSPVGTTNNGIDPASMSHVLYNLQYPPSGPTGTGLFFTAGDIAAAESGSLFGDGAIVTHPLHGIMPDFSNVAPGGNQFIRSIAAAPQIDYLQTAGQSYFIEPPQSTTTTQKPTFKRRKTRRPISSLAEKSRKAKAAEENIHNTLNNEVFQGNPVPFNPRQIVNTSFGGRKRPTDNKQGRPRSRPNTFKQATSSTLDGNNEAKNVDTLNEIPKAEGEPRVLGRRKPAQEVQSLRPTSTFAAITNGDDVNVEQPPRGGRRASFRKPRPSVDAVADDADADSASGPENVNPKPFRPRLVKRLKPRPTTTIAAPATETESEIPTEITDPITIIHTRPTSPQPQPTVPEDSKPRVRPARPLVVNRFANANRNTATTTPSPSDSVDAPAASLPPSSFPKRRPLRPTTRQQSLRTSTEAPEDILGNFVNDATPAPVSAFGGRGRGDGSRKPPREGRQGFLLRPRPTPINVAVDTSVNPTGQGQSTENEVGLRRPLSNRRRKRPTTTVASQVSPAVSYGQEFTGGIVEENVIPVAPPSERYNHGRRINPVLRSRQTPLPPLPATEGPPAYPIREQHPVPHPVQQGQIQTFGDITQRLVSNSQGNSNAGQNFYRRPTGPSAPASVAPVPLQSPIQPGFNNIMNNHPSLIDPNNFVPNFQFPQQQNLGFYPGGFDNSLGSPSNFRHIQLPGANEFSSRSTSTDEEPEISNSDFSPAVSTEKQSVSSSNNAETAATPSLENVTGAEQANKTETEKPEVKIPPVKLSPIERLQQNRQAAARRLLAPRKPTEKTTVAPSAANQNIGKNFRKSVIPPRMLRPRGKLPGFNAAKTQVEEKPVPNDGRENDSGAVDEKSNNNEIAATPEIANDASSSETEKQDTNAIPNIPNPKLETTTTRKPTILEAAKRRRVPSVLAKSADQQQQKQQQQQKIKATSTPPPSHDTETSTLPTCEEGQRYSKFLKRCVTMYKPRVQG